jgi:NitT/TauT family transport system substrate-binding protein
MTTQWTVSRRSVRTLLGVLGLLAVLGLPAAGQQAAAVVRVGTLKLVGGAPLFVAQERGYFRQEALDVRFVYFGAAAPVATAVVTGDTEVGATGITGTLFNLSAGGAKIWLVADRGQERPGYPLNAVVVSKAAFDQGVRTLRDLRGKRIGLTTFGSTFHYQIAKLLEREKLSVKEVELTPLREVQLVVQALQTNQVPAAILSPPWGRVAEQQGWGKVLFWVGDRLVNQVTGVFFGERMRQNHDLGVGFLKAYVRAVRDYSDACLAKPRRPACKEIVALTARYIEQPESAVEASLPYIDRDARLYTLDLEHQLAWYVQNGMVSQPRPVDQVVDGSFLRDALKALGR